MLEEKKIFKLFKSKKKVIIISIIIFFLLLVFGSDYGVINRLSLERKLKQQTEQVINEKQTIDSLQQIINQLQNDSLEIERIARENYGMVKANEEVIYIKKK